ncbi:uncharacterized protein LOC108910120 isoform X1 [Anoplophora glabripennis]|uniref:uncharacterized protein LOC108910120 isoform X1 n=1 Tax=Anoplophora glabripennis TaxID=217634 RepID=UPI000874F949|nr:uncharacterized protein LOC108910120 isoform X1 [Anoplophora glabripennis]
MDLKILLLTVAFFVCSSAAPTVTDEDRSYLTSVLEMVPESERKQFLVHQLYKGYILNHPKGIAVTVPEETTQRFYELFLRYFEVDPVDKEALSQLCFPSGECVDTDDPGVYP